MPSVEVVSGSRVTLRYTLSLAGGKVVESTEESGSATFEIGQSGLLRAFEDRLLGLKPGDRRRFEIPCMEAYGPSDADNVHAIPRDEFPPGMKVEPGVVVGFDLPNGEELPGTVVEAAGRAVMVNFSHPLSGHDLVFEVEVLDVQPPREPRQLP